MVRHLRQISDWDNIPWEEVDFDHIDYDWLGQLTEKTGDPYKTLLFLKQQERYQQIKNEDVNLRYLVIDWDTIDWSVYTPAGMGVFDLPYCEKAVEVRELALASWGAWIDQDKP